MIMPIPGSIASGSGSQFSDSINVVSYATIYRSGSSQTLSGRAYTWLAFNTLHEDTSSTEPWFRPDLSSRRLYVPSGINYVTLTWAMFPSNYTGDGYHRLQIFRSGGIVADQPGEYKEEKGAVGTTNIIPVVQDDYLEIRIYHARTKYVQPGLSNTFMSAVGYDYS